MMSILLIFQSCLAIWIYQAVFIIGMMTIAAWGADRLKNAGLVDVFWGFGFAFIAGIACFLGHGNPARQLLLLMMVGFASIRLGFHLWRRFQRDYPEEDGRYHALRVTWSGIWPSWKVDLAFILLIYLQGVLMWFLSVPFAFVANNEHAGITPVEWFAFGIWFIGFWGELISDEQLKRFKAKPEHRGLPCQTGLWRYSRHPNYFCEWIMWVAYALFALGSPGGWVGLYSPGVMFFLLTRVSGITATEAQALKTRGDAYQRYQQRTPAFFPWFPK